VVRQAAPLIDQSHDAQPESGETSEVVTSTRVGKCDKSWKVRLESGYTTGVASSDQSQAYDQSRAYNRSRDIPAF
jgi:hypothetical protein